MDNVAVVEYRDRILDWQPRFDEKSRAYPIRTLITSSVRRRNKLWRVGPILDQGSEGACVGFGWAADAFATPTTVNLQRVKAQVPRDVTEFAQHIYRTAKTVDEWEGVDYDGTSVLAGAKAMQQFGLLKEYRWAFGINDVVDAVLSKGPAVLGIYWHDDMYEAPNGVLTPSGPIVGGHCLTAVGYTLKSRKLDGEDGVILQNSWGNGWGINGLAEIRVSDLANLLDNDGEACVPSKRSYGR
jgi:Papain family cysteine protease